MSRIKRNISCFVLLCLLVAVIPLQSVIAANETISLGQVKYMSNQTEKLYDLTVTTTADYVIETDYYNTSSDTIIYI